VRERIERRGCPAGIGCHADGAEHGHPIGPRVQDRAQGRLVDAADRDDWEADGRAHRAHERQPPARRAGMRRGRVDRAQERIVSPLPLRRPRLRDAMNRAPQQKARAHDPTRGGDGQAVAAEVDTIGPHGDGDIRAVVDDQQRGRGEDRAQVDG